MNERSKKKPLVCFLVTSLSYGGAETVVIKLATELRKRGWSIKLISMLVPEVRMEILESCGIEVASLKMRRGVPDPRAIFRLSQLLKKWQPQILHCHMVHANLLGRLVRLITPIPVQISTAHNIYEGPRWREIAYRLTDPLADMTTNVSQAAVDRYVSVGAAPRRKIRFIPNGLDTNEFQPDDKARREIRENLKLSNAFVWLAIGRLTEAKDYPNMLRAFSQLPPEPDTKLLIVGQGELRDDLEKNIQELKEGERIKLLGVRRDIPQLINAADAYIMSSAWEGLPMVLLEASATGLPIVATDVGGNREIVQDGSSGIIVSAKDSEALCDAMQNIMGLSVSSRNAMGQAGRNYVQSNYSYQRVIEMWENLYLEFLQKKLPRKIY